MRTPRLLIIDDLPVFSAYVRDVAVGLDFDARVARHADDFRALHRNFLPDVVSLDVVMPQGDGLQLLNWLGDQDSRACVLILSGYGASFIDAAKHLAQAKGHRRVTALPKPIDVVALQSALVSLAA